MEGFIPTATIIVTHVNKSASDYVNQLKNILEAERMQPIVKDPAHSLKVVKFLEAMISGAEFEAKKVEVNKLKTEAKRISDILLKYQ